MQPSPPTRYEPGAFCWVGLATSDPAEAKRFYAALFGWESQDLLAGEAGGYSLLRRAGEDVAILYRQTPQARAAQAPPHWTSYISVADVDATASRATELGGAAVFRRPFAVLDAGRVGAIRDPNGSVVSLWQPGSMEGAMLVDEVDALCWNELTTIDADRAMSFYGDLLGWTYEVDEVGSATIWNAGRPNGRIREYAAREPDAMRHWLPYFGVRSADGAARQAERQGGHTLVPPAQTNLGRVAVLTDPQGAAFAALEALVPPRSLSYPGTSGERPAPDPR